MLCFQSNMEDASTIDRMMMMDNGDGGWSLATVPIGKLQKSSRRAPRGKRECRGRDRRRKKASNRVSRPTRLENLHVERSALDRFTKPSPSLFSQNNCYNICYHQFIITAFCKSFRSICNRTLHFLLHSTRLACTLTALTKLSYLKWLLCPI
jgi:hypothetical protein